VDAGCGVAVEDFSIEKSLLKQCFIGFYVMRFDLPFRFFLRLFLPPRDRTLAH
jgi:hypothetical protein